MRTNFQMEYQNITMTKGDTVSFNVEVKDDYGDVVLVDTADLTCKKRVDGEEVMFHKYLNSGITQTDGLILVRIAPEDTADLDAGLYFYDMQIGMGADRYTILKGVLTIEQNVTY